MSTGETDRAGGEPSPDWSRYGQALIQAMAEVLGEVPEADREAVLETADYWLSLGLALGVSSPAEARRLLLVIEREEQDRSQLEDDARGFAAEALA
ncbi:MAG TPA: hypothetical protein VI138_09175 [Candidatus Dormibacteraeota bacterium]